jgi:hypothetical protein
MLFYYVTGNYSVMFCAEVFTCLTKEKQAQAIGYNSKRMHFFDLKVALFWT